MPSCRKTISLCRGMEGSCKLLKMLDKTKIPAFSKDVLENYFLKMENIPFDSAFLLFQWHISRMLCANRVKIEVLDFETYPNIYILNLAPSGTGKDRTRLAMEKLMPFFFEDQEARERSFVEDEKNRIDRLAVAENITKGSKSEWVENKMPRSLFPLVKSNATPEGVTALHNAMVKAKFGAIVWRDAEIYDTMYRIKQGGSAFDLLTIFKETYDGGNFDPKIIQGNKAVKTMGAVPYLAMLYGAIDTDEGQAVFRRFFELGYARRLMVCMPDDIRKDERSIEETEQQFKEATDEKVWIVANLREIYNRTAVRTDIEKDGNKKYTLTRDCLKVYLEYKKSCLNIAIDMPAYTIGSIRDEQANRSWKALKQSLVFHVQNATTMQISEESLRQSIAVTDYYSGHFVHFLNMRSGSSLAEQLMATIEKEGPVMASELYTQYYFPKHKGNQKYILADAVEVIHELCAKAGKELIILPTNRGRGTLYQILAIKSHVPES